MPVFAVFITMLLPGLILGLILGIIINKISSKQIFKDIKKDHELLMKQIDYLWNRIQELEKDIRELQRKNTN